MSARLYSNGSLAAVFKSSSAVRLVACIMFSFISLSLTNVYTKAQENCSDVLKGDLFDKIRSSSNKKTSDFYARSLATSSEQSAYDEYLKAFESDNSSETNLGVSFPVMGVPTGADGSFRGAQRLSRSDFGKRFNAWKKQFAEQIRSEENYEESNYYEQYLRNTDTIRAWQECMARPQGGLFAYASRDEGGGVLLRVVYMPTSKQSVELSFVPSRSDVQVEAREKERIFGSKQYRVVGNLANGFSIGVNGEVLDESGQSVSNIDATVKVGPTILNPLNTSSQVELEVYNKSNSDKHFGFAVVRVSSHKIMGWYRLRANGGNQHWSLDASEIKDLWFSFYEGPGWQQGDIGSARVIMGDEHISTKPATRGKEETPVELINFNLGDKLGIWTTTQSIADSFLSLKNNNYSIVFSRVIQANPNTMRGTSKIVIIVEENKNRDLPVAVTVTVTK